MKIHNLLAMSRKSITTENVMKVKTNDLIGPALVWAVAILEFPKGSYGGGADHYSGNNNERWIRVPDKENRTYVLAKYPTDWAQGGPIIERESLCVGRKHQADTNYCEVNDPAIDCWARTTAGGHLSYGPTPLIAAMRCYVASKLGDEIDIPEELSIIPSLQTPQSK